MNPKNENPHFLFEKQNIYQKGVNFGSLFQISAQSDHFVPLAALHRKLIHPFGTAVVTLNIVRNYFGWAQIVGVGSMNTFT